ncbi:MAG: hypothetical protein HC880_03645 [Bacteroidia bacterium]|nr:hypothetical protein [Bacteroidia bacterium]
MKKHLTFLWASLFLFPASLTAQNFADLNYYKFYIVDTDGGARAYSREIQGEIARVLSQCKLPVYRSEQDLRGQQIDSCDLIRCQFSVQESHNTIPPYLGLDIHMYDCLGRLIHSFSSQTVNAFFVGSSPYSKAVEKALRPLRYYRYHYDPSLAQERESPPINEPLTVVTEKNTPVSIPTLSDVAQNIPFTRMRNPDAVAVIIGNQNYQDKDIPPVD